MSSLDERFVFTNDDYFAGHPWFSAPAQRAMELHRLIGLELNAPTRYYHSRPTDHEQIAAYRAEIAEIERGEEADVG